MLRRASVALVFALAALVAYPVGSPASAPRAGAAKLKACKKGANSKKCRCPKGSKLVKRNHKYRCKKKTAPQQQGQQGTGGDQTGTGGDQTGTGGDQTGTGGNQTGTGGDQTGTGEPPAQNNGAQTQRDDAGYTAALGSSRFGPHNVEGSTGLFTYTYDLCANKQFSFHSEYFSSSYGNSETYYNGNWQLEQGYRVIASQYGPGWAGILIMTENDGTKARIELDFNDTTGVFNTGTGSHFEGGQYQRAAAAC